MRQEYLPVADVEIAIRIPDGRRAKPLMLLRAGQEASAYRVENGYAVGTIPHLHIAEIVHLELTT